MSGVQQGVIRREERFGYVELATHPGAQEESGPPPFIRVWKTGGAVEVTFSVEMQFDLESGKPKGWQRLEIDD